MHRYPTLFPTPTPTPTPTVAHRGAVERMHRYAGEGDGDAEGEPDEVLGRHHRELVEEEAARDDREHRQ